MKTKYFVLILILLLASCRKTDCAECENICYYCEFINENFCSTSFQNTYWLESAIELIRYSGDECHRIEPTVIFEECDKDKKELFNTTQYECKDM
jgi:hypothetical protein